MYVPTHYHLLPICLSTYILPVHLSIYCLIYLSYAAIYVPMYLLIYLQYLTTFLLSVVPATVMARSTRAVTAS